MKLVTFESDNGPRAGVLTPDGIYDAWNVLDHPTESKYASGFLPLPERPDRAVPRGN